MNIFASSFCPDKSAQALDDLRLNKMIIESDQLLCTALILKGVNHPKLYRISHQNHPCAVWCRYNFLAFNWLLHHADNLVLERIYRSPWVLPHKTEAVIDLCTDLLDKHPDAFPHTPWVDMPNCTNFKDVEDIHLAYQLQLNFKWNNDRSPPTWRKRGAPEWRNENA